MAMQEFKFPDQIDKEEPPEDQVELELEGDEVESQSNEPEIEIVDDAPIQDRGRKPLDREVEEPTEEELNDYSAKVQKRMKELTHARHDERRKAEALARTNAELERVAKLMVEENQKLKQYVNVGQNAYIDKSKTLAEMDVRTAKSRLKDALDAGDTETAVAAQEELLNAQLQMRQVNSFKATDLQKQQEPVYTQPIASKPEPTLDDRLVRWAESNTWFEQPGNEDMTGFAYGLHNKLVREHGQQYTSTDEYYSKIDSAMRRAFPDNFNDVEQEPPAKPNRPKNVVASAQRTTAPRKIRLTVSQQTAAKQLGIPLELYAKEVAKLEATQNDR